MAWTAMTNEISYLPILLYIGAIFWTLGYDTIYGLQDASDDEVIGVKSTSIKFKNNLNLFIGSCYFISSAMMLIVVLNLKINYFLIFLIIFMFSLLYQVKIYNTKGSETCLRAFKLNNLSGLSIFLLFFFIANSNQ